MSSRIPSETCTEIAQAFVDFEFRRLSWQDLLEKIHDEVNIIATNCYAVGYYDAKSNKSENPMQVDDWRWQLKITMLPR